MAAPTENYVDPAAGNDYIGATFADGAYTAGTKNLSKANAFLANKVGHKLWLTGTGVTPGLFTIATRTDASNVILATALAAGDITDAGCTQHDGSIAKPFATTQGCLDLCGRDATNGDRINIKAGTADVLAATLSLTTYGTPAESATLIFEGYTATAGDGGIGVLDGNNGNFNIQAGTAYVHWKHLRLTNTGSARVMTIGYYSSIRFCEVDTSSSDGIYSSDGLNVCEWNYVHDCAGIGITRFRNPRNCFLKNGASLKFTTAISFLNGTPFRNIIVVDGASNGIISASNDGVATENSVLATSGTGYGISGLYAFGAAGNLIEGFSGAGGKGILYGTQDRFASDSNGVYNCTTSYSGAGDAISGEEDQEALAASPFAKAGSIPTDFTSATFWTDLYAYFAPVDTGNVYGGAWVRGGNRDKGAVQHSDPAGGSVIQPGMSGGMNG
jgi:hypothetical protein